MEEEEKEVIEDTSDIVEHQDNEELEIAITDLITLLEELKEDREVLNDNLETFNDLNLILNDNLEVMNENNLTIDSLPETIDYTEQFTLIDDNLSDIHNDMEQITLSTDSVLAYSYVFIPLLVVVLFAYWFFKQFMERYI